MTTRGQALILALLLSLTLASAQNYSSTLWYQLDTSESIAVVPVRYLAEWLGATISYDKAAKEAVLAFNGVTVRIDPAAGTITANGAPQPIPPLHYHLQYPFLNAKRDQSVGAVAEVDGILYAPLRTVAEALGCTVTWDGAVVVKHTARPGEHLVFCAYGDDFTPLHLDALSGVLRLAKAHIAGGADVNARDAKGLTPLHWAALSGQTDMAAYLLSAGASINAVDNAGETPLLLAAGRYIHYTPGRVTDQHRLLTALLSSGADPNIKDTAGVTATHVAVVARLPEAVAALVDAHADVNTADQDGNTPLHLAAGNGDAVVVQELLAAGAAANACDARKYTPLHMAILCPDTTGALATTKALIAAHASLDAQDVDGVTPLQLAIAVHLPIATYLVQAGAVDPGEIGATDKRGNTPLLLAAVRDDAVDFVKALLAAHARPDIHNADGDTALILAVGSGNADMVKALLDGGAQVNESNTSGGTPLHLAAAAGAAKIVATLLSSGADVNAVDNAGQTPLHRAATCPDGADIVSALCSAGAAVNARDKTGETPLCLALPYPENVVALVAAHADVQALDGGGRTALHLAAQQCTPDSAAALLTAGAAVDAEDNLGHTPLQAALLLDPSFDDPAWLTAQDKTVKVLIEHGASLTVPYGCRTALHVAAAADDLDFVKELLAKGLTTNVRTTDGATPLLDAVTPREGSPDVRQALVKYLLAKDADPNATTTDGTTPLHRAAATHYGSYVIPLLAAKGANPNSQDASGRTPLFYVAFETAAEALFAVGASPSARDYSGETPLFSPTCDDLTATVLIKHGVPVDETDDKGRTALYVSAEQFVPDIAVTLLDHGAKKNVRTNDGSTPLHAAVRRLDVDLARILLDYGADVNVTDNQGHTPLYYAMQAPDQWSAEQMTALLKARGGK